MGSSVSSIDKEKKRQFTLIIGKLENKSDAERRIYSLCKNIQLQHKQEAVKPENNVIQQAQVVETPSPQNESNAQELHLAAVCEDDKISSGSGQLKKPDYKKTDDFNSVFIPHSINKPLLLTQTYTSWRARDDLMKLSQRLGFKKRVIYFVLLDSFPQFVTDFTMRSRLGKQEHTVLTLISHYIEIFYSGMGVRWLPTITLSQTKWTIRKRKHEKTKKIQYLVSDLYRPLQKLKPHDGYCIMGISWTDLYPKEELNFVLGEANYMTESGVMSFGRFEPKTFDPEKEKDITEIDADLIWKLLKVASHELGHLFGLEHCEYFSCLMNGSHSISEALNQPSFLCPVCLRKIQHVCRFNIVQRYRNLLQFFQELEDMMPSNRWFKNIEWLNKCLEFVELSPS